MFTNPNQGCMLRNEDEITSHRKKHNPHHPLRMRNPLYIKTTWISHKQGIWLIHKDEEILAYVKSL